MLTSYALLENTWRSDRGDHFQLVAPASRGLDAHHDYPTRMPSISPIDQSSRIIA